VRQLTATKRRCNARTIVEVKLRPTLALLVASLLSLADPAASQTYPARPIHMLVPYAPGGPADIAARLIGAKLTQAWGQQVVVENRPGGRGYIAMTAAAKAIPDGYTLVMATIGEVVIAPALFKDVPYNVESDFAPISLVSDATIVLAAHGDSPFKSVADVIAAAKAQPGAISVGSPGQGTVNEVVIEWMALNTGTKLQHVPYKGSAPAANAIAGGEIPLGMLASSSVAPLLPTGRVRVLAVASAKRSKFGPQWPTLQEAGVADVDASTWTALFAPKGTPAPVIDKLNAEVVKILDLPDIKERFATGGVDTIPSSAAQLDARIKQDAAQFSTIVQKASMKPD
jgi:tripartite-type tricarboxylate transporter receptor subunit TctC